MPEVRRTSGPPPLSDSPRCGRTWGCSIQAGCVRARPHHSTVTAHQDACPRAPLGARAVLGDGRDGGTGWPGSGVSGPGQHKHKKPPQLQPCNGRWLNGGGIWGVRPSGFTREGLRMHRATCAVVGSESLPTHAGRLLVWYGVSPLKNRGYSSFSARRPHQVHLDRMALIPPNALPTLRPGRRGPLRGPHPPGVRPRTRGCPRGGDVHLPPCADSAGGG